MAKAIDAQLEGLQQSLDELGKLKGALARRILRKAITEASRELLKHLRVRTPVQTKSLQKSQAQKVKTYRGSGATVALLGPRADYTRTIKGKKYRPVRYAHIVEEHVRFMKRTWSAYRALAQEMVRQRIQQELEKGAK